MKSMKTILGALLIGATTIAMVPTAGAHDRGDRHWSHGDRHHHRDRAHHHRHHNGWKGRAQHNYYYNVYPRYRAPVIYPDYYYRYNQPGVVITLPPVRIGF